MTIRVVIADDHRVVRDGLCYLLSQEPDVEVVGEAGDGRRTLNVVAATRPDVLLLDLYMPEPDGHAVLAALHDAPNGPAVVVLTSATDDEHLVRAMHAGATSYLLKTASAEHVIAAVRDAAAGTASLSPQLLTLLTQALRRPPPPDPMQPLSPREREVLRLIARGHSNRQIARDLAIGEQTVKTHVRSILSKLGLQDRLQAAIFALRHQADSWLLARESGMANPHFANLGDVWKHLLLSEVISQLQPERYVETHAGSAIYRLVDDVERGLGAEMFLSASAEIEPLRGSRYRRHILEFARGAEPSYPGSPLLAMMLLGRTCRYVFCDTDPESAADLRAARDELGLRDKVRVIHGDGLAETTALLQAHAIGAASLVHIDPFDFHAAGPGVVRALELLTGLAAASIPTVAWYGLAAPPVAHELFHEVTIAAPAARAWCAELRVAGRRAKAAGIGSGCGVLFTAADLAPVGSMRRAADAYVRAFNEQSAAADAGIDVTASFVTSASASTSVAG